MKKFSPKEVRWLVKPRISESRSKFFFTILYTLSRPPLLSLFDLSFPNLFLFYGICHRLLYQSYLYLPAHICHSVGSESRNPVLQLCTPSRPQEKELAFIKCLLSTRTFHFFILFVLHNLWEKCYYFYLIKEGIGI